MTSDSFHDDQIAALLAPIEALLMVADHPLQIDHVAHTLDVEASLIEQCFHTLSAEYQNSPRPRGFELRHSGGGWRLYSHPHYAGVVEDFIVGGAHSKLSQAALETLAVIAYRQPISRARISQIRGVNVDAVVRTLVARDFVEEVGWTDSGARLYGTTQAFLERMGFESIHDLVPLAPYLPDTSELDELEESL